MIWPPLLKVTAVVGVGIGCGIAPMIAWPRSGPPAGVCIGTGDTTRLGNVVLPFGCMSTFVFTRRGVVLFLLIAGSLLATAACRLIGARPTAGIGMLGGAALFIAVF